MNNINTNDTLTLYQQGQSYSEPSLPFGPAQHRGLENHQANRTIRSMVALTRYCYILRSMCGCTAGPRVSRSTIPQG